MYVQSKDEAKIWSVTIRCMAGLPHPTLASAEGDPPWTEEPPPSLRTVQKRLGFTDVSLKKHFPDLCKVIVANYAQRRTETARMRKEALQREVREIMATLDRTGVVPTLPRVTCLLKGDSLKKWTTLRSVFKNAKRELRAEQLSY